IAALDQLVQPTVISRTATVPPASPTEGDTYVVAPSASGAWTGKDHAFACWLSDGWSYRAPAEGWMAYVLDEGELALYQEGNWAPLETGSDAPPMLGINAIADLTNRLTVASPATLFTHEGGDHRVTVNKAGPGDTASLVFDDDN